MFKKLFIILIIAVGLLPLAPHDASAATKAPFYYGAWLPFWKGQAGAINISLNLEKLDEVSPFSYEMRSDGTLIDSLHIANGSWDPWFDAVRDSGMKVIPTIAWFNTGGIYRLLSNARTRRATEDRIAALVTANLFDGIDIDFEAMSPATRPYYSLFIEGLAIRLHPAKKLLTCTVMSRTPPARIYRTVPAQIVYPENYSVLNTYCDEVRIMAYDQQTIDLTLNASKGNGSLYSPVADPAWVASVLQETVKYINPRKIMLGIPTYGYEYEVSWTGGMTTYQRVRAFGFFAAMNRAESLGITPFRNNAGELSFTFASTTHFDQPAILVSTITSTLPPPELATIDPNASTTFFVSFPDAQSIADKVQLAKKFGIRGVVFFKADGDIDPMVWQNID